MGSIFRVRRPGGRPAMAPPPPPWCHLANQHPREMPGNISFLSLRAVALQPLIERVMLKMKALPLRLVHALDACAPRTTHGRSSHLNSDPHVAAINITALAQPFEKGRQRPPIARSKIGVKKSDHRHRRLLRTRRERPRGRRAGEQRDERAPLHSITSSARASKLSGMARPSVLTVLTLIVSSYLIGCCTGNSATFAPLRIRSTYDAARLYESSTSDP